ncbi:MAG: cardiolipin synthase [Eubacterium sp.]|nr:cardiolipin synthase [Eubacterium sp.]
MLTLQVAIFIAISYYATSTRIIYIIIYIIMIILIIYIINDDSDPNMKMLWVILLLLVPAFGTLMYLYFRFQPASHSLKKKLKKINIKSERYLTQDKRMLGELYLQNKNFASLANFVYESNDLPIYRNTEVTYFRSGEDKYKALIEKLEEAQDFIFMEYFIIGRGKVWDSILRILEKKVQQGVEVRVMYDGLCSFSKLDIGYYKKLQKKGIKAKPFAPARPFITTNQNNRDHRKILVIDGKVAFTGGINLADEYMNIVEHFGIWKDTAVMVEGDAAKSFTLLFLKMWNVSENTISNFDRYLNVDIPPIYPDSGYVMAYADNPFNHYQVGHSVYLDIINNATRYCHIITPYLVLDNITMNALKFAAKRGVDVKIIMPGIPDKKYAYCLARTYYKELIRWGVEIYEYSPGFTHAKVFVADDEVATVGTYNLDYRSLYLHFENGCFMYKCKCIKDIEDDFQDTKNQSSKVTLMGCKNRPLYYKATGKVMRLISPML